MPPICAPPSDERQVELTGATGRLDRALADALPDLSRARIQALMVQGAITRGGEAVVDPSARAVAGLYRLIVPAPIAPRPVAAVLTLKPS